MSSTTLQPGQGKDFTDHEGGTDLKVTGTTGQPFTTAVDGGSPRSHTLNPGGYVTEVADRQTLTVTNTSTTNPLNVAFPAEDVSV
jgi:hypothetical protein